MPTTSIVLLRFKPEATTENIQEVRFSLPIEIRSAILHVVKTYNQLVGLPPHVVAERQMPPSRNQKAVYQIIQWRGG